MGDLKWPYLSLCEAYRSLWPLNLQCKRSFGPIKSIRFWVFQTSIVSLCPPGLPIFTQGYLVFKSGRPQDYSQILTSFQRCCWHTFCTLHIHCQQVAVYLQCTCSLHCSYTETILPVHSTSVWATQWADCFWECIGPSYIKQYQSHCQCHLKGYI